MAFDDRLQYLLVGMAIGFVFGYLVRLVSDTRDIKKEVHDVKKELDEVDEIVKRIDHDNEGGYFKISFTAIAVLLIVGLTAYSAFVSQKASNDIVASQERTERISACNRQVLADVIDALNDRSTYTTDMADANIDLQQAFADLLSILLHEPPYSELRRARAIQAYYENLQAFLEIAKKNRGVVVTNPYPTIDDFSDCLRSN